MYAWLLINCSLSTDQELNGEAKRILFGWLDLTQ